jgi:hypothetical protein
MESGEPFAGMTVISVNGMTLCVIAGMESGWPGVRGLAGFLAIPEGRAGFTRKAGRRSAWPARLLVPDSLLDQ